jgi:hypothetical protein
MEAQMHFKEASANVVYPAVWILNADIFQRPMHRHLAHRYGAILCVIKTLAKNITISSCSHKSTTYSESVLLVFPHLIQAKSW